MCELSPLTDVNLPCFPRVTTCDCPAGKSDRLRQAKAEAEREIAAYKAEREGAYQKKVSEVRLTPLHGLHCRARLMCVG